MRLEELERELRAERPEPELDFARRLDEWAEAGFPRDRGLGPANAARAGALRRAWDRISSTPPRRILVPVGAAATAVVIAGVVITNADRISSGGEDSSAVRSSSAEPGSPGRSSGGGAGTRLEDQSAPAAPSAGAAQEYSLEIPRASQKPSAADRNLGAVAPGGGDTVARGTDARIVDATARLTLGAGASEVQEVANGVVEVTDRYDGIVSTSQVTRDQGGARASFELEIPYKHLDAALSDLSGLADVISRTEGGEDITARAVRARKDLARTLDGIREARIELIKADSREERLVIKSRIASLQAQADAQQQALKGVERQGRFATVGVEVTSDGPEADDGGWSLGDALDDAGRVLEVIGGIALVSLAVLLPVSLIAALAAFAISRARRRAREQALDS